MDPRMLVVHNYYKVMILDEIDAKNCVGRSSGSNPTSGGASATASSSTPASSSASALASSMGQPDRAEHDEVIVLNGPTSTQDVPSSPPNYFFWLCSIHSRSVI
jgi:hypothetical protein